MDSTSNDSPLPKSPIQGVHIRNGKLYARVVYRGVNGKQQSIIRRIHNPEDSERVAQELQQHVLSGLALPTGRFGGLQAVAEKKRGGKIKKRHLLWMTDLYNQARGNAKSRDIHFNLTREEFNVIVARCGVMS